MSTMLRLSVALAILLAFTVPAAAFTKDQLRDLLLQDMRGDRGEQEVVLGPMLDGRTLRVTVGYDTDVDGVATTLLSTGNYLINFSRGLVGRSFFVVDAMIVCEAWPKACLNMADYLEQLDAARAVTAAPFIDDAFPELEAPAGRARDNEKAYAERLTTGISGFILFAVTHELGHAAFKHGGTEGKSDQELIAEEAEADGFAATLHAVAELPPFGAPIFLLSTAVAEELGEKAPTSHPPALCRLLALSQDTIEWLGRHRGPSGQIPDDELLELATKAVGDAAAASAFGLDGSKDCSSYAAAFASGVNEGLRLITSETHLDATVPKR